MLLTKSTCSHFLIKCKIFVCLFSKMVQRTFGPGWCMSFPRNTSYKIQNTTFARRRKRPNMMGQGHHFLHQNLPYMHTCMHANIGKQVDPHPDHILHDCKNGKIWEQKSILMTTSQVKPIPKIQLIQENQELKIKKPKQLP